MSNPPIVGITMGDPAGIGSEVIVKAYPDLVERAQIVVIGDEEVVRAARDVVGTELDIQSVADIEEAQFRPDAIPVLDLENVAELEFGVLREEYGRASLAYIERAIELAKAGEIDAITTAPINKQATQLAGSKHSGHTGMLAEHTGTDNYSMILIDGDLRVSHVSTHVPLREACDLVTEEAVLDTIRVTDEALLRLGVSEPRIAVAGLNPHASDGGLLGDEEAAAIGPAVERAREEGIEVFGPESPDTIYVRAADGAADCVVSMYHDQGHIPIKMLGFSQGDAVSGVNVTAGLPIVRTSVDHGTAFDIAGEGIASPQSLVDAVEVAVQMVQAGD